MAEVQERILVLTLLVIAFSAASTAVQFNVDVADDADSSEYEIDYRQNVSTVQQINFTVENTGSLGCKFTSEAEFMYGNTTDSVMSPSRNLWPGDSALLQIHYLPLNYSGPVQADLYVRYCGKTERLKQMNFTVEEARMPDTELNSRTESVSSGYSRITIDREEAILVPDNRPSGWKAASARVEEGRAEIEYEPSLFRKGEEISYTVLDPSTGDFIGSTSVVLQEDEDILEKLSENGWTILLVLSMIANLLFLARKIDAKRLLKDLKSKMRKVTIDAND